MLKVNIGYVTGATTQLSTPINVRTDGYYQSVEDIELVGIDLLNNKYNSSRFTFLTKKDDFLVQMDNKTYKEDAATGTNSSFCGGGSQ